MQPAGETPGVTPASPAESTPTPTAATGDTTPPAPEATPPASEGVNPPESEDKHVPYERFKEVNDKAKQTADELEKAKQQLADFEASKAKQSEEDAPQLDPEAQKVLDHYLEKQGFVTQEQLHAKELQLQADSDVRELKGEFSDFDKDKVLDYAKENGLLINDKNGLRSVYNLMKSSDPSAKDALRNEIIAELKESGQLAGPYAEKPGPGGARITKGEQPSGLRGRLHAAVQKHSS